MTKLTAFKAYDVRGRIPDEINESLAYDIGRAYAGFVQPRTVAVGYDIRETSPGLAAALKRGLTESGVDVLDIGLCGTEGSYFATSEWQLDGGIMVTASHNPPDYNGMKFVREGARPISADTGLLDIKAAIASGTLPPAAAKQGVQRPLDIRERYVKHLLGYVEPTRLRPLKVVVNAGNGGAGLIVDLLQPHLPFQFIKLNHEPDGTFPHGVPNPMLEENRAATRQAVLDHGADVGLAWDGDYDRCFFFDAEGTFIEGYYLVGLLAEVFLKREPGARIVHDPRLTWNTIDVVTAAGGVPVLSKSGHAFIKQKMREVDGAYGGEMSAHHYFRSFAYCDSGMIPWLLVLQVICESGHSLSQLVGERMRLFPASGEINTHLEGEARAVIGRIQQVYAGSALNVDFTDGLSVEFAQWRFNLRGSNTEPLVRLNVESRGSTALMQEKTEETAAADPRLNIWARKPVEELCAEAGVEGEVTALPRSLGVFALTCIGVGATVGAGIFVLTGSVAAEHSGPAVGISFLLASIVCLLAGLCYAELAAMIPVAGSAYSYAYATLGEGIAWTVGWCLMLEYLFSASLVAISWAGYAQSTLHQMGIDLPAAWLAAPFEVKDAWHIYRTPTILNLPAVLVTAVCTVILLAGVKTSARLNSVMVVAKVIAILVVVFVGARYVHTSLWHPYIPKNTGTFGVYGWSGVFQGTAILFFAYIGFDAVSTMGQEVRNPQRAVPLSLLLGLAICAVLYLAVSFVVTGLVGYHDLDVPDPMYLALDRAGPAVLWAKYLVGFVAVVGLVSVLLVTLMGQVRIFYAMGRDGLLPAAFARVHPRTRTPHIGTIVTGVVSCIAAGLLPLDLLGDVISMGTLLAFGIVCGGVLVLRRTRPDLRRPFKAPGGIWVPLAGALCCAGLMATLPRLAWKGFLVWLVIGLTVYALYGATRSKLQRVVQN